MIWASSGKPQATVVENTTLDIRNSLLDHPGAEGLPSSVTSLYGDLFVRIYTSTLSKLQTHWGPSCYTGCTGLTWEEASQSAQKTMSYCLNPLSYYSSHVITGRTVYPHDRLYEMLRRRSRRDSLQKAKFKQSGTNSPDQLFGRIISRLLHLPGAFILDSFYVPGHLCPVQSM